MATHALVATHVTHGTVHHTSCAQESEVHEQGGHIVFTIPSIYLSIYLSISISISQYLYLYIYIYLYLSISIYLSIYIYIYEIYQIIP